LELAQASPLDQFPLPEGNFNAGGQGKKQGFLVHKRRDMTAASKAGVRERKTTPPGITTASRSYRPEVWGLGKLAVRVFPRTIVHFFSWVMVTCYCALRPERKEVVVENLLPLFNGDPQAARAAAGRLFKNFAGKLIDLWHYEMGQPVHLENWSGWTHFTAARERNVGMLLVTAHLGNWEFGAPFLIERGVKLLVLTQAEPKGLTEIRQASRARWGIETLVIGTDAFAFLEVIKRLQDGAAVALLIDRPPPATAVTVELFGKPFAASIAAAELARASGCVVLPVCIVRTQRGYSAQGFPEIQYDRPALRNREARRELTQKIVSALEPAIRQYPDQWYNFVPLWEHNAP
jgi:lauroyl/myristoyl acyltransferase